MIRLIICLGLAALGLTGIQMSTTTAPGPAAATCTADSGKAFAPELTPAQICDRFRAALGDQANSFRVTLHFSERGMASATSSHRRSGAWTALPVMELAVMDRRFTPTDIDRLAHDVLSQLALPTRTEEN